MARIDYVDPANATERTNDLLKKLGHKNIFRMLGHSERHFETYVRMGNAIRFKGSLDPVLRELAITRTGILCDAEYEIVAHKRIGKDVGVSDEKNAALEEGASSDAFTELEKAVLRFTDDVVQNDRASDATLNPLAEQLSSADLVELYLAIGFYIMTSKFLRTFDVDMQTV
ncbi:MAG: carboxymuconolactone decarboxylase family protein [Alphaproteobacteria bacterium]|nr:carboxymuconolactone decarboxylase family protein [Alphaproteobacteria bacterium]